MKRRYLVCLQDPPTQFSYAFGGRDWPGLCETGLSQSPINIVPGEHAYLQHSHPDVAVGVVAAL